MGKIKLSPYIFFKGNAREAMEFYKSIFGGELTMQTIAEVPDDAMPPDMKKEDVKDQIMHARLHGGEVDLMGSDSRKASVKTAKVELSLSGADETKMRKVFDSLAQGGKITMPLEKQFWGDSFGMLTDKFGVDWMVNIGTSMNP
jgi:PhnB protein